MAALEVRTGINTRASVVQSAGATIEVNRFGTESGPAILACTCGDELFQREPSGRLFSISMRGYGASKIV